MNAAPAKSPLKKFIHVNLRLNNAGILTRLYAVSRNHCEMESLSRFCLIAEHFDFVSQSKIIGTVYFKWPFREFYLA